MSLADNLAEDFYCPVELAAMLMDCTEDRVRQLVRNGALLVKSDRGRLLVRPAR